MCVSPEFYLEKLVGFDTVSSKSNRLLTDWLAAELKTLGLSPQLIPSRDGQKASVFASIGDPSGAGIGLSGHTDVVPVTGQSWTSDPFVLRRDNGRLYGRGTADMKGYLACMLAAIPEFQKAQPSRPVHLLFSYDEETGCTGVRPMLDLLGTRLPKPRIVIVGEPTRMRVVDAHKGIRSFVTEVHGLEGHSSTPQNGVNAVMVAADLVAALGREAEALRQASGDVRFDPPYTTVHVGTISGGTAQNIIPRHCLFSWECRLLPGRDGEAIIKRFEQVVAQKRAMITSVSATARIDTVEVHNVPDFGASQNNNATALALRCAKQNDTFAVSYGTEAGLFQRAGCAAVVCGPGDIAEAHKPDEYIEVAELEKCMAFMRRLAAHEAMA